MLHFIPEKKIRSLLGNYVITACKTFLPLCPQKKQKKNHKKLSLFKRLYIFYNVKIILFSINEMQKFCYKFYETKYG